VLCFARDHSISVASTPEELQRCNALAWYRNRYYGDLRVIDAVATPYRVGAVELARPLDGWRRLAARIRNQELEVVLQLEQLGGPSLDAAREMAIDWIHQAPEFWEAAYELDDLESRLRDCSDMEALCTLFA
jgi:hypothetical protein